MEQLLDSLQAVHARLGLEPEIRTEENPAGQITRYEAKYAQISEEKRKLRVNAIEGFKLKEEFRHLNIWHNSDSTTHYVVVTRKDEETGGSPVPAGRPVTPLAPGHEEAVPKRELVGSGVGK